MQTQNFKMKGEISIKKIDEPMSKSKKEQQVFSNDTCKDSCAISKIDL